VSFEKKEIRSPIFWPVIPMNGVSDERQTYVHDAVELSGRAGVRVRDMHRVTLIEKNAWFTHRVPGTGDVSGSRSRTESSVYKPTKEKM